jgi:hypothetical protein
MNNEKMDAKGCLLYLLAGAGLFFIYNWFSDMGKIFKSTDKEDS